MDNFDYQAFLQRAAEEIAQIDSTVPVGEGHITPFLVKSYLAGYQTKNNCQLPRTVGRDLEDMIARLEIKNRTPIKDN